MGGSLLGGRRIDKAEYSLREHSLCEILTSVLGIKHFRSFEVTYPCSDKESFGDIDVVVLQSCLPALREEVNARGLAWKNTSEGFSFLYEGIQVDLLGAKDLDQLDWKIFYYSFGDLGNLIGRLARNMGFVFGHDGFWIEYSASEGNFHKKHLVTLEVNKALQFLGAPHRQGELYLNFPTRNDIFEFVSMFSSFHPNIFRFENRNFEGRHRDKKRPNYMAFLEYLDENWPVDPLDQKWRLNKDVHRRRAELFWPELKNARLHFDKEHLEWLEEKNLFEFGRVNRSLDKPLEGPAFGKFVQFMKQHRLDFRVNADYTKTVRGLFDKYKEVNECL